MTRTLTYEEYEAARQASAGLQGELVYTRSVGEDPLLSMFKPAGTGSFGHSLLFPYIGSSSSVVVWRGAKHTEKCATPDAEVRFREVLALSTVEQLQDLLAALSLNKSQLANILRVTRPTMYDWFQGKNPNAANAERLQTLLELLSRASVSGENPLNARFVRQRIGPGTPSLIELLSKESLDEETIVHTLERVRGLGDSASQRRTIRENRLRALGFEDPSDAQRKEQLARNVALQNWPKP